MNDCDVELTATLTAVTDLHRVRLFNLLLLRVKTMVNIYQ